MIRERTGSTVSGWVMLPALIAGMIVSGLLLVVAADADATCTVFGLFLVEAFLAFLLAGFFVVNPNEARVLTLFGKYAGSVKTDGFHWANPLLRKRHISLRIRNFESTKIKVNDHEGQPDRDRRHRRLARRRDRGGPVRGRQLRTLREGAERSRRPEPRLAIPLRRAHRGRKVAARKTRVKSPISMKDRGPGTARQGGRRSARDAHQPSGLRARDRRRDAAASAGGRDHRGPSAHRRRRGRHGRDGARAALTPRDRRRSTTSARPRWSATCWSCSAAIATRNRSSTPGRSISNRPAGGPSRPARRRSRHGRTKAFSPSDRSRRARRASALGRTTTCAA